MAGNSKNNKSKKNAKNSKSKENESNVRTGKFEKSGSNANDSSSSQPIKIQMSFTTTVMLNNENSYRSVPNSICCNKENMLKCQLFHGDLVIVQSVIEGKRYFCCCRIHYVPSVPNTNILCSKDVLRVLSPTFKSVPATVFKLAPGSAIVQASECVLEICPKEGTPQQSSMNNADLYAYIKMKLYNSLCMKNQMLMVAIQGIYYEVYIRELATKEELPAPSSPHAPPPLTLYQLKATTLYQMRAVSSNEEKPVEASTPSLAPKVGGLQSQKEQIAEMMAPLLSATNPYQHYNLKPSRGILLYGPPGTGKTLLVRELCEEYHIPLYALHIADLMTKYAGESEAILRSLFKKAALSSPSVLFLDEVDSLCPSRDHSSSYTNKMTSLLLSLLDGLDPSLRVLIFGATNRPQSIDSALRRPGRFDKELEIGVPSNTDKIEILKIHLSSIPHQLTEQELIYLSTHTNGYVGADLKLLCQEASLRALNRYLAHPKEESFLLTNEDLIASLALVRPSALREITIHVPHVYWKDIGGNEAIKQQLREVIDWPFLYAQQMQDLQIHPPKGILLFGPPGCSKTLFAKVIATESNMNFISIKGPELFSKYVGESEQAVMNVFKKARAAAPCVLFFDEIDALATSRGGDSGVTERVITQLLQEMDGIHTLKHILVIGATNRPDLLDNALLRPGRFDIHIYCPLPDEKTRFEIFKVHTRNLPLSEDVDLEKMAEITEGYSGAEIAALCREAAICCLSENIQNTIIGQSHFDEALLNIIPRTSPDLLLLYQKFIEK